MDHVPSRHAVVGAAEAKLSTHAAVDRLKTRPPRHKTCGADSAPPPGLAQRFCSDTKMDVDELATFVTTLVRAPRRPPPLGPLGPPCRGRASCPGATPGFVGETRAHEGVLFSSPSSRARVATPRGGQQNCPSCQRSRPPAIRPAGTPPSPAANAPPCREAFLTPPPSAARPNEPSHV